MGAARNYTKDWEDGVDLDDLENCQPVPSYSHGGVDVSRRENRKAIDQERQRERAQKESTHGTDED